MDDVADGLLRTNPPRRPRRDREGDGRESGQGVVTATAQAILLARGPVRRWVRRVA